MPQSLSDLDDSVETQIVKAVGAILRGGNFYDRDGQVHSDSFFAEAFRPIVLLDAHSAGKPRLLQFAQGTLAVMAGVSRQVGQPSDRTKISMPVFILAYVPDENVSEDSLFNGSNICGKLRELLTRAQELRTSAGDSLTYPTMDFQWVDAVVESGTLVAAYRAIYETDVSPSTGDLI